MPTVGPELDFSAQRITYSPHRSDQGVVVVTELGSQGVDLNRDNVGIWIVFPAPHRLQDLRPAEHIVGSLEQHFEQLILAPRELQQLPVVLDLTTARLKDDATKA